MKYLASLFLSFFIYGQALADCSMSGIWAYPSESEITTNSIIILEGYSTSQKIIDSLNIAYPIYLEAEGHVVKLKVKETCKGMYFLTQAILSPEQALLAGKTYKLRIDNLNSGQQRLLNRRISSEREPIQWTVKSNISTVFPKLISPPVLVDKTTQWLGCGPAIYALFDINIEGEAQTFIKTQLINLTTKETNTYYLTSDAEGILRVGHGMCSGAFDFKPNNKYQIRFSLLDLQGNASDKWSAWIKFDSPFENNN